MKVVLVMLCVRKMVSEIACGSVLTCNSFCKFLCVLWGCLGEI